MGGGGRMHSSERSGSGEGARAPVEKPPFTLGDLRRVVPPHCFQRSLLRSSAYLAGDLLAVCVLAAAAQLIERAPGGASARAALWVAYWAAQGCVATGVWVIAHECGHHAFSEREWVDDAVGFALHSALLVPYFSWKFSHRRHHSNTGSVERDEVFVPKPRHAVRASKVLLQHAPGRALQILVTLTCGWPLYLLLNVSGRAYDRPASHFHPGAPIFNAREKKFVLLSDAGLLAVGAGLLALARAFGFGWLLRVYGVPLLVVNAFLVLITFLQHTHPALPHYRSQEWDWMRGALSTVDRDYGLLNHVMHHITDTHVAHHIFSTMPHYHAQEATRLLKPVLGEYYQFDSTPVWRALWRETKECLFVEPDADADDSKAGILWYRNKF